MKKTIILIMLLLFSLILSGIASACQTNADCGNPTPYCHPTSKICVYCLSNADCGNCAECSPNNYCLPALPPSGFSKCASCNSKTGVWSDCPDCELCKFVDPIFKCIKEDCGDKIWNGIEPDCCEDAPPPSPEFSSTGIIIAIVVVAVVLLVLVQRKKAAKNKN
jgi:hypothetical protein